MSDLENLVKSFESENETTCSHRVPPGDEKIVFIHDSYQKKYGRVYEFSDQEYKILNLLLKKTDLPSDSYQFVAAVKDFNVSEDDLTTKEIAKHREYLQEDLEAINPTLVIPLGNLALKTLTKKSGISTKRGKEFVIQLDEEDESTRIPVAPTLHPFSLYAEPKLRDLFIQDVNNAYRKYILKVNKFDGSPYELLNGDLARFDELMDICMGSEAVAFDLETEGLDFKKHKLLTFGISYDENQAFVFPINHKESEWSPSEDKHIKKRCAELLASTSVAKIAHNVKFDYKFLKNWGLTEFNNLEDTQIMHSLVDENLPHALMDLVKQYFPEVLED
jgi:uracil-DNA glycosylase family 4